MKSQLLFSILILTFFQWSFCQEEEWEVNGLTNLPFPIAHNTIVEARVTNQDFVYSFSGVKDSIHVDYRSDTILKYNVVSDSWEVLNFSLDSLKTIGRRGVFTNNRIYLFGGYYFDSGDTLVDGRTLVFNPFQDTLDLPGANAPTPVYDQVTAVWRDSLVFNIGGVDNVGNYSNEIQIYNPLFNSWSQGDELPNNEFFKFRGAGGYILGDTIYILGGVSGEFVPSVRDYIRKGVINPNNPEEIDWVFDTSTPDVAFYNGNCSGFADKIFYYGGSDLFYDFNFQDPFDSLEIFPNSKVFNYFVNLQQFSDQILNNVKNGVYGIANVGGGNWITAGGVDSLGMLSNKTLLLSNKDFSSLSESIKPPLFNVIDDFDFFIVETENIGNIEIHDISGRKLFESFKGLSDLFIPKSELITGMLIFIYDDGTNLPVVKKKVLVK